MAKAKLKTAERPTTVSRSAVREVIIQSAHSEQVTNTPSKSTSKPTTKQSKK